MTTALIDGDIVAYRVAARCGKPTTFGGEGTAGFDEADVRADVEKLLDDWTRAAGADERVILLTGPRNFRKLVDPTYKSNRSSKDKPAALDFARSVLRDEHHGQWLDGLEADDLIGLMLTGSMAGGRGVAVSIDKDLRTIPGLHCNPLKGGVRSVSPLQADHLWMTQTLIGDKTDGYGGAPGIGPAKAKKALPVMRMAAAAWPSVVEAYKTVGGTEADAVKTARLARILRRGDYDKDTMEVVLWHPATPSRLCIRPTEQQETPCPSTD